MGFGRGSCVQRFENYLWALEGIAMLKDLKTIYSMTFQELSTVVGKAHCMQLLRPRWNASKDVVSQGGS